TAFDYAIEGDHGVISQRLLDCQYELTDRLSYFLCGRRPDHLSDQHFVIPEMSDSIDVSDLAKDAKLKLQSLSNKVFQEIAKDVYDEVDRRELNEISSYTQGNISSDNLCVPFLPVTPQFSAIRNQGRQKLARYNARDFATLVIDILTESRRRQFGVNENVKLQCQESIMKCKLSFSHTKSVEEDEDSEPVYDSVASEDESVDEKIQTNTENWCTPNATAKSISDETKIEELISSNKHLQRQIDHLYFVISKLTEDNSRLKKIETTDNGNQMSSNQSILSKNYCTRPQSMFERHVCSGTKDMSDDDTSFVPSKTLLFPQMNKNDILRITEVITKSIQELLAVALENRVELFLGCAQNVLQVVKNIHSSYREDNERKVSLVTHTLIEKLYNSALTLYTRCNVDYAMIDKKQLSQQVIESAYDVAKAAKELITKVMN
ncbi:ARF GTPase-activating protein GIT2-like isoform X9, partial [Leptotrombidium deliense]